VGENCGDDVKKCIVKVSDVEFSYRVRHASAKNVKQLFINFINGIDSDLEISALHKINFEIYSGDVLGIVGNNGAGKSTLLKIIAGILPPSQGEVEVIGQVMPIIELGVGFNPELTCRENIELLGVLLGYKHKEMRESTEEIANWAGVHDYLEFPIRTFSTGMTARLAFAISTFNKADLLIVDEALSVGDPAFQSKSLERLSRLIQEGEAAILVSHDLSTIASRATKVLWLDQGRQMMLGNPQEVLDAYRKN